jgi:hypothetical protein
MVLPAVSLAFLGAMALPIAAHADGRLDWSGNVDDRAAVSIHGRDVRTQTVSGKSVQNVNLQMFGRLPTERPVFVNLTKRGRGSVRVVQQPGPFNNYTAIVRIHDPQPGAAHYRFRLEW